MHLFVVLSQGDGKLAPLWLIIFKRSGGQKLFVNVLFHFRSVDDFTFPRKIGRKGTEIKELAAKIFDLSLFDTSYDLIRISVANACCKLRNHCG